VPHMKDKSARDRKKCADKIRKSIVKYENDKIPLTKMVKVIEDCGIDSENWTLDEQHKLMKFIDQNKMFVHRRYDDGDNSTRFKGFTHNPTHTAKGRFFQNTIKNTIRKALHLADWYIVNKYDKDAYVYDDLRLKGIDDFMNQYIDDKFQHAEYKLEIMHQVRHIFCFMIKEDPYYTSVAYDFFNQFIKKYPTGFTLTKEEQYNFDMWHTGTFEEIQEKYKNR